MKLYSNNFNICTDQFIITLTEFVVCQSNTLKLKL